jgi:hypothetical protein
VQSPKPSTLRLAGVREMAHILPLMIGCRPSFVRHNFFVKYFILIVLVDRLGRNPRRR